MHVRCSCIYMNSALVALGFAVLLAPDALPQEAKENRKKEEYYKKLGEVPPLSAAAHADLAEWCRTEGLEEEALKCFNQAIEIDADCERARLALGYERYGTGWRKKGAKPVRAAAPKPAVPPAKEVAGAPKPAGTGEGKPPGAGEGSPAPATPAPRPAAPPAEGGTPPAEGETPPAEAGSSPGEVGTDPGAAEPPPAAAAGPAKAGGGAAGEGAAGAAEDAKPEAATVSELQRKKAWAAEAAQKIAATFVTVEDRDFLIHTTLPKGSRELATLRASLAGLKKLLAGIVGARTNATIWPGKLQFVLLRSEPEYERFAQMVDGEASAKNPDGAYTKDGHTALWKPDSPLLAELLGESALENFEGSDRWVGWWLRDGVAVLLLASSPEGQKQETYKRSFFLAADLLKAEGDNYKVFNLLETRDYKSSSADRNRALALTLVDYLVKKNRTGLGSLIKALKSDKAPAPARSPAEQDSFHLSYISFQSQAIESAFGMQVSALDGRWKEYVHQMAQKLKEQEEAAGEKEKEKEKEKGGKKPR